MSSVNSSPTITATPFNRPETKVHELTQKEMDEIPEPQKKVLMAMPGEPDSIWTEVVFENGNKISSTTTDSIIREAPAILSMFINLQKTEYTHIAFGDFKFKYNSNNSKISRTPYTKKSSGATTAKFTPWVRQPPKPKYVSDIYVDTVEGAREFLAKQENKKKWEMLRDPVVADDGKVTVFLVSNTYD